MLAYHISLCLQLWSFWFFFVSYFRGNEGSEFEDLFQIAELCFASLSLKDNTPS
jgi:hypothetical protein